jgi:hypothetical protein
MRTDADSLSEKFFKLKKTPFFIVTAVKTSNLTFFKLFRVPNGG